MRHRARENIRTLRHDVMMKVVARDDRGLRDVIASHGLDCNFVVRGRHILSLACASSSVEVVHELLAGGALITGSSVPGGCPQQEDPLLVVIRLNREDVFEELLKRVQNVACVVPWTCLTERRYAMLDVLLQRGFCHDFLELMTSDLWGAPQCRFLRRYLPALVSSNVLLDNWEITTEAGPSSTAILPLSAVP
ncbi:Ankyrin repeat-containing domain [Trinorchestia longiramus]|nr:Ankyrin repeat-containing domain [Trinorchestia longiramus]